jgi:hypothetical protein
LRKNLVSQRTKNVGIPKEAGDLNQQIPIEGVQLFAVAQEDLQVLAQPFDFLQGHAAGDAPADGGLLVEREVHSRRFSEQLEDSDPILVPCRNERVLFLQVGEPRVGMECDLRKLPGNTFRRQHEIDASG